MLCEKAKWFYYQISEEEDFQASQDWLKKRHGICQLTINGEKLSLALEPSQQKFLEKIIDLSPSTER